MFDALAQVLTDAQSLKTNPCNIYAGGFNGCLFKGLRGEPEQMLSHSLASGSGSRENICKRM